MAIIHFNDPRLHRFTGEARAVEVHADSYRDAVEVLARKFPGIESLIGEEMVVAIDGIIIQDPWLDPLKPDSEVFFMAKLGGG